MLILGIDTSCDDTSASIVEDGSRIVSNIVSSQSDIHTKYGGIVPELASRKHIEMILPVVDEALRKAGAGLEDLSAIAVCHGPGLIGSLLVGCSFAKAVCFSKNIPLVAVNHLEGHLLSAFLEEPCPEFPFLSLIVSGGHTSLSIAEGYGRYKELGRTRDDAAGEAYDKVSKLLGLGYPGGPVIDRLASKGDPRAIDFPRAYLHDSFDFSFSGIKTAVLNYVRTNKIGQNAGDTEAKGQKKLSDVSSPIICDIAASFQAAVIDMLAKKVEWAIQRSSLRQVAISGGVSANRGLRLRMAELGEEKGIDIFMPSPQLCTDNAAMIAVAGYHHYLRKNLAGNDLNPQAYLPL